MAYFPPTGSVVGFQSDPTKLLTHSSVSGTVSAQQTGTRITSISGIPQASVHGVVGIMGNPSISGTIDTELPAAAALSDTTANPIAPMVGAALMTWDNSASVFARKVVASVSGTTGASVIGTVPVTQSGTWTTSLVSTVPSSVLVGASIFGLAPVNVTNTNLNVAGSVAAFIQGTPNVNTAGSVVSFQGGTVITSISGIPQASVHGTVQIFPASVVTGTASLVGAASIQILAAPGTGLRSYITDFLVSNTGSSNTLVSFTDGDGSVIGKTIAPSGGGSNAVGMATPMIPSQNKVVNIVAATATSVLHAWIGGYLAP